MFQRFLWPPIPTHVHVSHRALGPKYTKIKVTGVHCNPTVNNQLMSELQRTSWKVATTCFFLAILKKCGRKIKGKSSSAVPIKNDWDILRPPFNRKQRHPRPYRQCVHFRRVAFDGLYNLYINNLITFHSVSCNASRLQNSRQCVSPSRISASLFRFPSKKHRVLDGCTLGRFYSTSI